MIGNLVSVILFLCLTMPAIAQISEKNTRAEPSKNSVKPSGSNQAIIIKSPVFVIELPSNPSTGFSWFLGYYDPKFIHPIKREYKILNQTLTGSPGQEHWYFKIKPPAFLVPTILTLEMIYVRPWSLEEARRKTYKIVVYPQERRVK